MEPRALRAGLPPTTLLLACLLIAPAPAASTSPISLPAFARGARPAIPHVPAPAARPAMPLGAGSADGTWQEWNLLQVSHALAIHDPVNDQLLSIGGASTSFPRSENWALPLTGSLAWQALPAMTLPHFINLWSSAVDPATGLVYFLAPEDPQDPATSVEVHTLDPQTGVISIIPTSGARGGDLGSAVVFDSATQRLFVIEAAPFFPPRLPDVWALDLLPTPSWSHWTPSGTPSAVNLPIAALDPVRRRVLVFSLGSPPGAAEILAFTLDGSPEWLRFPTNGLPSGAYRNRIAYDPVSDRMWTLDTTGEPFSLSLETHQWSSVPAVGPGPSPRQVAGIAIDPVRHRLLVNGGSTPSGDDTHSDAWALALDGTPAWTQLVLDATRPPIREGGSDGYDASRHRMIVFGGNDQPGGFRNDTWALDLGPTPRWSPVATQSGPPPGRAWHASAWDDAHDRFVVYGGFNGDSLLLGDVWALSFAAGAPTWSRIAPAGPAPPARYLSQMVYDSARDRFLVLFGQDDLGDVWELRLSPVRSWRQLAPTGVPPAARSSHMCVYDPARDRVLMFGGSTSTGYANDLWALNLGSGDGAWVPLPVPAGPSGRYGGLLRLDSGHDRLVLFGGNHYDFSTGVTDLNDTWTLDLAESGTWRLLSPTGFIPERRGMANGAYDPIHDRLVLACGGGYGYGSNDVWTLNFADEPTPTLLDLASREVTADRVRLVWAGAEPGMRAIAYRREPDTEWRSLADLIADGEGRLTLEDRDVTPGATLEYRLGVMTGGGEAYFGATRVEIPRRALSLSARAVDGRASFRVELASGEPATLVLFDVAGRSVWSRAVGHLGAGSHEVSAGDATLPAALYFARLTQGEVSRFARFAVVR